MSTIIILTNLLSIFTCLSVLWKFTSFKDNMLRKFDHLMEFTHHINSIFRKDDCKKPCWDPNKWRSDEETKLPHDIHPVETEDSKKVDEFFRDVETGKIVENFSHENTTEGEGSKDTADTAANGSKYPKRKESRAKKFNNSSKV